MLVMTYNIQSGRNAAHTLEPAGSEAVIRRLAPEVCMLHEVRMRSLDIGGAEQARDLGEHLGMEWRFFKAMEYDGGDYGIAFLSRAPILSCDHWVVPATKTLYSEPRIIFRCVVKLEGQETAVYGTHFGLSDIDLDNATNQAEELLREEKMPALFMGDLNMRPDDPRIGRIEACIPNTAPGEPFCTFPSPAPDRKIDYIFATSHFRAEKTWAEPTLASDHLPLIAQLSWA